MEIKVAKNYINGEWVAVQGKESLSTINPSTGETIGTVNFSDEAETNAARYARALHVQT